MRYEIWDNDKTMEHILKQIRNPIIMNQILKAESK
jgi:hypothetical protein